MAARTGRRSPRGLLARLSLARSHRAQGIERRHSSAGPAARLAERRDVTHYNELFRQHGRVASFACASSYSVWMDLISEICQGEEMVRYPYPTVGISRGTTMENCILSTTTARKLRGSTRETGRFSVFTPRGPTSHSRDVLCIWRPNRAPRDPEPLGGSPGCPCLPVVSFPRPIRYCLCVKSKNKPPSCSGGAALALKTRELGPSISHNILASYFRSDK